MRNSASECVGGLSLTVLTLALGCATLTPLTDSQLGEQQTAQLVARFLRVSPSDHTELQRVSRLIKTRAPGEILAAIASVYDDFDPKTGKGRSGPRGEYAYWVGGLLYSVDNSTIRVRTVQEGRAALAACWRRLERQREAGYDREPRPYKDGAYSRYMAYQGELSQYRDMNGVNETDRQIVQQLEHDYGVRMSDDEVARFSEFLTAKDPRYVAWSGVSLTRGAPVMFKFDNFDAYYRAYQEFRRAPY